MWFFRLAVVISLVSIVLSSNLKFLTFEPPYETTTSKGTRIINEYWDTYGVASVNNNFIRLTPDRQSKKGAIWSKKTLGVDEFSATFKFRISGQGEKFFGDGLALWITHSDRHFDGTLHGSEEYFYGLGVIIDTFKNTERLAAHRDVLVITNNAKKNFDQLTSEADKVQGCNVNVRYHEKRDDFSVSQTSRMKIVTDGVSLQIQIDEGNNNEWFDCVNIPDLGLPEGWLLNSHIGFTASTGQLADNHDILSFNAYSDAFVMESEQVEKLRQADLAIIDENETPEANMQLLNVGISDLLNRMEVMEHEAEHKNLAIMDEIKSLLAKIEQKTQTNDVKIGDLEGQVKAFINDHLDTEVREKLEDLEDSVHSKVDRQLYNVERKFDKNMNMKQEKLVAASKNSGGWKLPFFFLLLLILLAGGAMFAFYQKIRKMHLL